ncbi:glycosyl transferase group 1 [Methylobacterium sp. 4-46]|uniref:glycosyltransferase n=1 Tax=unclassified Methylobacterium TaxID=2615210 RepID=UPI000152D144|nr:MULTISPECIES: glycosyltransferase [Methylobacterium]ACA14767.1 glycosyl transferase group 1 [Methylobacterium sp. 4-46]WFT80518.1 glycosyltransferase [Methylobacterium nodulans]
MAEILVDISQFVEFPARSGIQRVVSKLLVAWGEDRLFRWVRFDPAARRFIQIPPRMLDLLRHELFLADDVSGEIGKRLTLELASQPGWPVEVSDSQIVFVPEVFYSQERVKFYRELREARRIRDAYLVFDFMPWLKPSHFAIAKGFGPASMPYIQLLHEAHLRLFISRNTREEYVNRVRRAAAASQDAVVRLGADGLGGARQAFSTDRKRVCCVGAFDGKKGQDLVYDAFNDVETDLELHFAGKLLPSMIEKYRRIVETTNTKVWVHDDLSDSALVELVSGARASIFVSENEGFGLPALESLFIGVPLIASASLPALEDVPEYGQIQLGAVNKATVAGAFHRIADDQEARRLAAEIALLGLPTWTDFAANCRGRLLSLMHGASYTPAL